MPRRKKATIGDSSSGYEEFAQVKGTLDAEKEKASKAERRRLASETKEGNLQLLGHMLGHGIVSPVEGAEWMTKIERCPALAGQQAIKGLLAHWVYALKEKAETEEVRSQLTRLQAMIEGQAR